MSVLNFLGLHSKELKPQVRFKNVRRTWDPLGNGSAKNPLSTNLPQVREAFSTLGGWDMGVP